jgi:PAS domain S-box-containing protein
MSTPVTDFGHFFENSLDLLCIAGLDGFFKEINPAWEHTLGFTKAELVAVPYLSFIHPDDQAGTIAEAQKIGEGGSTVWFENRYRCKDGSYKWLLWKAWPDMERGLIYASARDISKRKAMEQELIDVTQLQQAILDGANFSIISTGPDGMIRTFNAAAERHLGYKAEEVVGKTTPAIIHDAEEVAARAVQLSEELGRVIEPGFETFVAKARTGLPDENEWTYIRKDGSRYPVLLSVTALFDRNGEVSGFMGVGHDIASRKQMEDELRRSNQDLEQFAYVASHDLHEPLRVVTSYLQLLERRLGTGLDEDSRLFMGTAIEGARRMRLLIQDLLAYSRVGTRGRPMIATSLDDVLRVALSNLEVAISQSRAVITNEPLPHVIGDSIQLVQLFQNLIGNAIKFCSHAEPKIHVAAQHEAHHVQVNVSDNGIGIDPKSFARIFMIFQRLHTREEYEGTGIGLAVCKRIIERHSGRIWVESQLGEGSTFCFTLPCTDGSDVGL